MTKIIIGFVALAVVLIFVMNNAGHVEMGGEHAGQEAMKGEPKVEQPAEQKADQKSE